MTDEVTPVRPDGFYSQTGSPLPGGGHTVVLDGTQYDLEALHALRNGYQETLKRKGELITRVGELQSKISAFESRVRNVFGELVADDDLDREKANEVLEELGLERLAVVYDVELSITVTGSVESTEDGDTVADRLAEYLEVDVSSWGSDYQWETDAINTRIDSVSEQ